MPLGPSAGIGLDRSYSYIAMARSRTGLLFEQRASDSLTCRHHHRLHLHLLEPLTLVDVNGLLVYCLTN